MPISPDEARDAVPAHIQQDPNYVRLCADLDAELSTRGSAAIKDPTIRYSRAAVEHAMTVYGRLWDVRFQRRGQMDVEEYLFVNERTGA